MRVRLGLDTGGTFTDLIGLHDDGRLVINKVPSTPQQPLQAIVEAVAGLETQGAPAASVMIGTTVATNALLQRAGATVLFLTTAGFEDIPFIQRMNRRYHYSLTWRKPMPLVERRNCIGVAERMDYRGQPLVPLRDTGLQAAGDAVADRLRCYPEQDVGIAICLLFSYLNPAHELLLRDYLQERFPQVPISLSHLVAPIWREYERGSTVIADAYIKPLIGRYVAGVRAGLREAAVSCPWALLKSNGGSTTGEMAEQQPIGLLRSGLSGGLLSGQYFAQVAEEPHALTLDMGGTSCDVGVVRAGKIAYMTDFQIEWGLPVSAPSVDITTIGAGGGSIAWIDKGGLLRVGPQSAGAEPGPICYGRGGSAVTVTDANLVLGRLNPTYFLGGRLALQRALASEQIRRLGAHLGLDEARAAQAVLDIADENMANALRVLSINRGLDPREFVLVAFGGAGPLHAANIARTLGMARVLIPPYPGLCSAFGTLLAGLQVNRVLSTNFRSTTVQAGEVAQRFERLTTAAVAELRQEGSAGVPVVERSISMRYWGQNYEHDVPVPDGPISADVLATLFAAFDRIHEGFYGYAIAGQIIELIRFNVTASDPTPRPTLRGTVATSRIAGPQAHRAVYIAGHGYVESPIYRRDTLGADACLDGPLIVEAVDSTILVYPGQRLSMHPSGSLIIDMNGAGAVPVGAGAVATREVR